MSEDPRLDAYRVLAERLVEALSESHAEELAHGHFGDDPATCSYCQLLKEARGVLGGWL